jgi:hypothetical protein
MPRILCIGEEPALTRSRAAVLRTTSCDVLESDAACAMPLLLAHPAQPWDMVLLCHTVLAADAAALVLAAQSLPSLPLVLRLSSPFGDAHVERDGVLWIGPFEGPRKLAAHVCRLLSLPPPIAPRPARFPLLTLPLSAAHPLGIKLPA